MIKGILLPLRRLGFAALCVGLFAPTLSRGASSDHRVIAASIAVGEWYSDSFRSSFIWGGGLWVFPLDWMGISVSYESASVKVPNESPLFNTLNSKKLGVLTTGLMFPLELKIHSLTCYLYPVLGYVYSHADGNGSHGLALGGGLEFQFIKPFFSVAAEMRDHIYQIPYNGGRTDAQSDVYFLVRGILSY
jgi:hypothetical protein